MPRVTRSNSIQNIVDVESSPEKDDKSKVKVQIASERREQPHSQRVMIVPDSLLENGNERMIVVKLRNPKTSTGNLYAFSHSNTIVYEINQLEEPKSSWFIGNSVESDGSLFVTTKIDPLFLILPYLCKAKHASPVEQLLVDDDYSETKRLSTCVKDENLEKISDMKQAGDFKAWKYNEQKTLEWLEKKVLKLQHHLKAVNHNVTNAAVSSTYIKTTSDDIPESSYTRYAFGLISEYLSCEISNALEKHLNLPPVIKNTGNEDVKEPPTKRQKLGSSNCEPTEDYSKDQSLLQAKEKTPATTAKAKAFANAAKGTKSISSFFGKK